MGIPTAGGNPRIVIERNTPTATFDGTFRVVENTSLEANPRFNSAALGGTGTLVNTGNVLAGGDIEFAGWGSTLDVRDSEATTQVLNYTANEITVTTTQAGGVNVISPGRGDTAAGTGHLVNFGTLTMGDHRLVITGNNSYSTGFADTASIRGNAVLIMNTDNVQAVFSNTGAAISEDAAGRSLTLLKAGGGTSAQRDVIVGGAISLSNLEVATGNLQLRGAGGAIGLGFGGAAPTITINGGMSNNSGNGQSDAGHPAPRQQHRPRRRRDDRYRRGEQQRSRGGQRDDQHAGQLDPPPDLAGCHRDHRNGRHGERQRSQYLRREQYRRRRRPRSLSRSPR